MPYYLPIAGGWIIRFIPFPRVLVQCEMQSVSSRIWTHVAMSISYDDNHYTTVTSKWIPIKHIHMICKWIVFFKWELVYLHTSITIVSTQLNGFTYCYQTFVILFKIIIYFQIVKWLQVSVFNNNYSIQHNLFICTVKCFQVLLLFRCIQEL